MKDHDVLCPDTSEYPRPPDARFPGKDGDKRRNRVDSTKVPCAAAGRGSLTTAGIRGNDDEGP